MGGLRHHAIALQTRSLRIGPEKPPDLRMCTCFAGRTRAPSEPRLYTANFVPKKRSVINANDALGSLKTGGRDDCELAPVRH